jgi:hypothetical protein
MGLFSASLKFDSNVCMSQCKYVEGLSLRVEKYVKRISKKKWRSLVSIALILLTMVGYFLYSASFATSAAFGDPGGDGGKRHTDLIQREE